MPTRSRPLASAIAVIRSAMGRPPVLGSTLSPNFTGCAMVLLLVWSSVRVSFRRLGCGVDGQVLVPGDEGDLTCPADQAPDAAPASAAPSTPPLTPYPPRKQP